MEMAVVAMETHDLSKKIDEETQSKLEQLEMRVTKVIEKLHGYVTQNCAKASLREKCSSLGFDLDAEKTK
jgi:hypothetical protein